MLAINDKRLRARLADHAATMSKHSQEKDKRVRAETGKGKRA
jgi:hypothetical protein